MEMEDEEMPVVSPTATPNDLGEEDEEELDLAFDREGSVASYDSDASNERFERGLIEGDEDESDISEYESQTKKKPTRPPRPSKPKGKGKERASNARSRSFAGAAARASDEEDEDDDMDVDMQDQREDENPNEDFELGGNQASERANENGRANVFDRMVNDLAVSPAGGSSRPALKERDQALLNPLEAIREDLRAAKGFKSHAKGSRKGARFKKLSPELQELSNNSAMAFVSGDNDEAFRLASEMIRIDAEIPQAWSCLAGVHESRGDHDKELGCRLMHAQLSKDGMIWNEVRERAIEAGNVEVAKYAQKRALSVDPWNPEVLLQSGIYFTDAHADRMALKCFRRLFTLKPYDIRGLKACVYVYASRSVEVDIWEGIQYLVKAFEHHIKTFSGPYDDHKEDLHNEMDREYVEFVVDLLIQARDYEMAGSILKRGERWLQSRSKQTFWDKLEDDSEYDPPGAVRADEDLVTEDREGYDLDPCMRARLAVIRLKLGQDEDADIHVRMVRESETAIYSAFWINVAETLMGRGRYIEALEMLQAVYSVLPDPAPPAADEADPAAIDEYHQGRDTLNDCLIKIGICNQRLLQLDQAVTVFTQVLEERPEDTAIKGNLASVLEDRAGPGDLARALQLVKEVREAQKALAAPEADHDDDAPMDEGAFFTTPQTSYHQLRTRARFDKVEAEVQLRLHTQMLKERLEECEERAFAGDSVAVQSYVSDARQMITEFRQARELFPKEKGIKFHVRSRTVRLDLAEFQVATVTDEQRLEDKIDEEKDDAALGSATVDQLSQMVRTHYLGLSADEWLDITIKMSILLMREGKETEVIQMTQHMSHTAMFQPEKYTLRLNLTTLSAAMRCGDLSTVLETIRFFTAYYQHRLEPWQLVAALGAGSRASDRFTNTIWQKYLLRRLRLWNSAASGVKAVWHDPTGRWTFPDTKRPRRGRRNPTRMIAGSRTVASKADHRIRKPPQAPPEPQSEDDDSADSGDDEEAVQDMHLVTQPMRAAPMPGYRPERPLVPRKRGILLEFLYGQTLASARSWQGAIAYYLRAYRMDPYDSLICLSLAHAYLARSLQRQCDNKMHMTTLGVTFLNRYRAIRKQDASDDLLEEIEYNFGRAFHGIGILNLAVKHYRQALMDIEARMSASEDPQAVKEASIAGEAAYNLMSIFLLSGSPLLAKNISDKWLSF